MKKNYTRKDVAKITGTIWNDNTRTVAKAVNYNADVLKQVLDRLSDLENHIKSGNIEFVEKEKTNIEKNYYA